MAQVHFDSNDPTRTAITKRGIGHVVRIRETQEYDLEVTTTGNSRVAATLARRKFIDMTAVEQAGHSVGVTSRSFEVGEEEFDEDELAGDADD